MQRIGTCMWQRIVVLGLSLSLIGARSSADPGIVEAAGPPTGRRYTLLSSKVRT